MLTTASAPALVGAADTPMVTKRIRVERAFRYGGETLAAGAELEVPANFAAEMVACRKAVIVTSPPAPASAPAPEAQAEPPKPAPKKGKSNAR